MFLLVSHVLKSVKKKQPIKMVGFIDIKSKETPLRMNPCQAASALKNVRQTYVQPHIGRSVEQLKIVIAETGRLSIG